jgi:tetratricopeptide (TPR) repeat protein
MEKSSLCLLWCLLLSSLGLKAQAPLEIAQKAQEAYQKGAYEQAIDAYEQLISAGYEEPSLCYNLGNACFRAKKLGKAVLYYEKALSMEPNDEATLRNLALVRAELSDQIDNSTAPEWWDCLLHPQLILRPNAWAILFALFTWLGMGLWWAARRKWLRFPALPWVNGALLGLALLALLAAGLSYWQEYENPTGVILSRETTLRIGPEQASPAIRTLHEGTKVAYLDKIGTWDKVRLANGQEGWLEGKSTGRIK